MTDLAPQSPSDRALTAFRRLVMLVYPAAVYWIVHEYTVVDSDGSSFSGIPTDASFSPKLPTNVPYSPSLHGTQCTVPQGTLAYVGFANADRSKPYLVRFGSGLPSSVTVDSSGDLQVGPSADAVFLCNSTPIATNPATATSQRRVVCYGDVVNVGTAGGPMTLTGPTCSRARA